METLVISSAQLVGMVTNANRNVTVRMVQVVTV